MAAREKWVDRWLEARLGSVPDDAVSVVSLLFPEQQTQLTVPAALSSCGILPSPRLSSQLSVGDEDSAVPEIVWAIVVHSVLPEGAAHATWDEREAEAMRSLADWARRMVPGHLPQSCDWNTAWRDGIALCALVNSLSCGHIDIAALNKNNAEGNLSAAITVAEHQLGIAPLVAPDIVHELFPERPFFAYVAEFYHWSRGRSELQAAASRPMTMPVPATDRRQSASATLYTAGVESDDDDEDDEDDDDSDSGGDVPPPRPARPHSSQAAQDRPPARPPKPAFLLQQHERWQQSSIPSVPGRPPPPRPSSSSEAVGSRSVNAARVVKEGYLIKRGKVRKSWKRRWFVLTTDSLSYYSRPGATRCKGSVALSDVQACAPEPFHAASRYAFQVVTARRVLRCIAPSGQILEEWVSAVRGARWPGAPATRTFAQRSQTVSIVQPPHGAGSSGSAGSSIVIGPPRPISRPNLFPTMPLFVVLHKQFQPASMRDQPDLLSDVHPLQQAAWQEPLRPVRSRGATPLLPESLPGDIMFDLGGAVSAAVSSAVGDAMPPLPSGPPPLPPPVPPGATAMSPPVAVRRSSPTSSSGSSLSGSAPTMAIGSRHVPPTRRPPVAPMPSKPVSLL